MFLLILCGGRPFIPLFSPFPPLSYINCIQTSIAADQNEELLRPVSTEEVNVALVQMHPDKVSGPDGFSPGFY